MKVRAGDAKSRNLWVKEAELQSIEEGSICYPERKTDQVIHQDSTLCL